MKIEFVEERQNEDGSWNLEFDVDTETLDFICEHFDKEQKRAGLHLTKKQLQFVPDRLLREIKFAVFTGEAAARTAKRILDEQST